MDQIGLPKIPAWSKLAADERGMHAAFTSHQDTWEEFEKNENEASITVFVTVVVRLDDRRDCSTSVVVNGFTPVVYETQGSAVLFPSALWHYTKERGGLKVAFFLGWPYPNMKNYEVYRRLPDS